jgi:hypothetical protein
MYLLLNSLSEVMCRQYKTNELIGLTEIPYFYVRSGCQYTRAVPTVGFSNFCEIEGQDMNDDVQRGCI